MEMLPREVLGFTVAPEENVCFQSNQLQKPVAAPNCETEMSLRRATMVNISPEVRP